MNTKIYNARNAYFQPQDFRKGLRVIELDWRPFPNTGGYKELARIGTILGHARNNPNVIRLKWDDSGKMTFNSYHYSFLFIINTDPVIPEYVNTLPAEDRIFATRSVFRAAILNQIKQTQTQTI
jgi:hypothetical protein